MPKIPLDCFAVFYKSIRVKQVSRIFMTILLISMGFILIGGALS
jgi:hypothetical protein